MNSRAVSSTWFSASREFAQYVSILSYFLPSASCGLSRPLDEIAKSKCNKQKQASVSKQKEFHSSHRKQCFLPQEQGPTLVESIANVKVPGSSYFSHSHGALWDSASWDMLSRKRTGKQVLAMTAYEDYKEVLVMVF